MLKCIYGQRLSTKPLLVHCPYCNIASPRSFRSLNSPFPALTEIHPQSLPMCGESKPWSQQPRNGHWILRVHTRIVDDDCAAMQTLISVACRAFKVTQFNSIHLHRLDQKWSLFFCWVLLFWVFFCFFLLLSFSPKLLNILA